MDRYGFYPSVTYTYTPLRQLTRKTTDNLFYRAYAYRAIHIRSAAAQAMNLHFLQEKALEHMVPELFRRGRGERIISHSSTAVSAAEDRSRSHAGR